MFVGYAVEIVKEGVIQMTYIVLIEIQVYFIEMILVNG
jgi:hypothetical protein